MTRFVAIAVATALIASSSSAQTERKTLTGSSIAIYDLAGRISVEQGQGSDVVVEVTRGGRDADKLKVDVGDLRGRNSLRVIYPDDDIIYPELGRWSSSDFRINDDGTWDGNGRDDRWSRHRIRVKGGGSGIEAWADLKILVPAGKDVAVYLGVGHLGASGVTADLALHSASGRVTVGNTKGNLIAETGSGGVEVGTATGNEVRIEAGSGSVSATDVNGKRLSIRTGSGGATGSGITSDDLDISTGSGSVQFENIRAPRANLESGSGGIRAAFTAAVTSLDVRSGSGGVTISLPANTNVQVDAETGSGGIDTDFPMTLSQFDRNHVHGKIGDGSGRIRISTGSGSVRLRKT